MASTPMLTVCSCFGVSRKFRDRGAPRVEHTEIDGRPTAVSTDGDTGIDRAVTAQTLVECQVDEDLPARISA
jgi:hypothetical protein